MSTRVPSRRERMIVLVMLYVAAVAVTTLYYGWLGFLASAAFLALGFWFAKDVLHD